MRKVVTLGVEELATRTSQVKMRRVCKFASFDLAP